MMYNSALSVIVFCCQYRIIDSYEPWFLLTCLPYSCSFIISLTVLPPFVFHIQCLPSFRAPCSAVFDSYHNYSPAIPRDPDYRQFSSNMERSCIHARDHNSLLNMWRFVVFRRESNVCQPPRGRDGGSRLTLAVDHGHHGHILLSAEIYYYYYYYYIRTDPRCMMVSDVPTTPSRSRRSHNNRSPVLSRNISISIDPADFRNLQDPFAPSPPSSPPADSDKGFFIPGVPHARTATSKFSKAKRKESETTLVAAAEKEKDPRVTLDESIDKEEAMLSQLLLRSLGGSNSSLQGPTECKDRDRDIVVVTCERRGSESTLASSGGGGKLGHRGSESTLASMSLSPSMPTFPLVVAQSSSSLIHHPHHFPGFETVNWHGTGTVLSTLYEPRDPSPSPLSLALHGEDEMSTDVNLPIPMHVGSPPSR